MSGRRVVHGVKETAKVGFKAGANMGGSDGSGGVNMKLLKFLYKKSQQNSFKGSGDFILAVQLKHIKFVKGKADPQLVTSTKNASMADGGKAREGEIVLEYQGMDANLEAAEEDFCGELHKTEDDGDEVVMALIEDEDDKEDDEEEEDDDDDGDNEDEGKSEDD